MFQPLIDTESVMQIQVVFFDLGKVLLNFEWKILLGRAGWNPGTDLGILLDRLRSENLMHDYETGRISTKHFLDRLQAFMNFKGTPLEMRRIWDEIFEPMEENIEIMRRIKSRYPVGLISNINESHLNYIETQYEFIHEIPERVYSCRAGARKPDSAIYRSAMDRFNVEPGKTLFIDDVEENILGARALGMNTIHYTAGMDLLTELQNYLEEM